MGHGHGDTHTHTHTDTDTEAERGREQQKEVKEWRGRAVGIVSEGERGREIVTDRQRERESSGDME